MGRHGGPRGNSRAFKAVVDKLEQDIAYYTGTFDDTKRDLVAEGRVIEARELLDTIKKIQNQP